MVTRRRNPSSTITVRTASGLEIDPGLTVNFETPEQLLERLFALSQALVNDLEALAAAFTSNV